MPHRSGRHFLQLPGPSNVPDRVLRAMDRPTIDHRGPAFAEMTVDILDGLRTLFESSERVYVYPSSASGAWEAALVNTLSAGDRVLLAEHGFFASQWRKVATRLGLDVEVIAGDWREPVDPAEIERCLRDDPHRRIKAVMVVHNETSTGVASDVHAVRRAIDRADHPALFLVDAVSSLASMPYSHDAWGVDVTVAGSQKGLMLPPGLSFTAVSARAQAAAASATLPRSYWDWDAQRTFNERGFFPYTPATNLLFGLRESLVMLGEEGMEGVFARHRRLAQATRLAVGGWGLETYCRRTEAASDTVTAVLMPEGVDADAVRATILDRFDMSLGTGLGHLKGDVFRIGHLGDLNDLMLCGTLAGITMGLQIAGAPGDAAGLTAALDFLARNGDA